MFVPLLSFMKLATYRDGSRDGQLVLVSRDLRFAHYTTGIASRMQQVLDDWSFLAPQLQDLSHQLGQGRAPHAFAFDPTQCMAPLPRPAQWVCASAYAAQQELAAAARGEDAASVARTEALLRQGSGYTAGPCDDVILPSQAMGIDMEGMWAVVTGDVPMGCTPEQALLCIRLVLLANDWALRQLQDAERARGCVGVASRPVTSFSPVAVTLDELGDAWKGGRLHLPLHCSHNGKKLGQPEAGEGMDWHMGQIIAQLCRTRSLRAGTMVGSGGVLNAPATTGRGKTKQSTWPTGAASVQDKRHMATVQGGDVPVPAYLQFGDSVRLEMKTPEGASVFGALDQVVISPEGDGAQG